MVKLDTVAGFCVISWGDWTTGLVLLCRLLLCIHPILILEGAKRCLPNVEVLHIWDL